MMPLHLIFMGSPDFSVPALAALLDAGHDIVAVYSQPPRPAGRGHKEKPSAVHAFALEHGLTVHTPVSLKGEDEQAALAALGADACVVVAEVVVVGHVRGLPGGCSREGIGKRKWIQSVLFAVVIDQLKEGFLLAVHS